MDLPPLADLHRHLDGSLRPQTLEELAAKVGVKVPGDIVFYPGMGLAKALESFAITLSVLQTPDAVERVAREICEDAVGEGVTTLEIRFAPQLHREAPVPEIVDAALSGVAGRAGIILCGLYGEPPAVLEGLVACAVSRPGVVGIDLAGGPDVGHEFRLDDYAEVFGRAREMGLGRTVHAGEGRPPQEIRAAIETLHANRIGHGTTLLADEGVTELVIERQIPLEACVTSNMQVGAIPDVGAHPIAHWLARGVQVCICTDNTLFSGVSAPREHARVCSIPGMSGAYLETAIRSGHAAAFGR